MRTAHRKLREESGWEAKEEKDAESVVRVMEACTRMGSGGREGRGIGSSGDGVVHADGKRRKRRTRNKQFG